MRLSEFHAKFPGGVQWRVLPDGVEQEGLGMIRAGAVIELATASFVQRLGSDCADVSRENQLPVELLIACAMTQSQGDPGRKFVWRTPGYVGDSLTPDSISAGICRMSLSMAHFITKDETLDHVWLLEPRNSLAVAGAYMRFGRSTLRTGWDPILTACAFNAGGLYLDESAESPWRLRQYSMLLGFPTPASRIPDPHYATQFAGCFGAARRVVDSGGLEGLKFVDYRSVLLG